jgi:hypothetical protein
MHLYIVLVPPVYRTAYVYHGIQLAIILGFRFKMNTYRNIMRKMTLLFLIVRVFVIVQG